MTDDPTPHDPFAERLTAQLRQAADPVGAAGVTRDAIDARVLGHHRTRRTKAVLGAAAATIALVAGIAVLAAPGGDGGTEQVDVAAEPGDPDGSTAAPEPRCLSFTDLRVELSMDHLTLEEVLDTVILDDGMTTGELLFRLGYTSGEAARILLAGQGSGLFTQEQVDALVAYERTLPYQQEAATGDGSEQTPFDEWTDVLRQAGLLTEEQEAEVAAGRGFGLTDGQSEALEDYWASQVPTTTAPASTATDPWSPPNRPVDPVVCLRSAPDTPEAIEGDAATTTSESTTTTSEVVMTSSTTTTAPADDRCAGRGIPEGVQAGPEFVIRPSGEQPEGTVDLLLLLPEHVASLQEAGIVTDEQIALAANGVYTWVFPEQQAHLSGLEPDVVYPQAFHYAVYPDRGGRPSPTVIEVDPDCVGR